jgi:hypothetical protein
MSALSLEASKLIPVHMLPCIERRVEDNVMQEKER